MAEGKTDGYADALRREILRSEQRRMQAVAIILGALLVATVVATQGPGGMTLYVDGVVVGTNPQTQAQAYSGYWRVGGDTTTGMTGGLHQTLVATIDDAAVYSSTELTGTQVATHYSAGR